MSSCAVLAEKYKDLLNPREALDARIRCLYTLKESDRSLDGAMLLLDAVDTTDSVLLQHELLYNVGQFGFPETIPRLMAIVSAPAATDAAAGSKPGGMKYDVVSRHEAIEGLGAIGCISPSVVGLLERYVQPAHEAEAPIRESCALALARLEFVATPEGAAAAAPPPGCHFVSVDPAPASGSGSGKGAPNAVDIPALQAQLLDASLSLWQRYRVMFQLRNIGSEAAVLALACALRDDTSSALFRHEIAFVLGQLEHPSSAPALTASLRDQAEHPMVRHESAEALGALAEPATLAVLEAHCSDAQVIVRDSCIVAIEMHKYWSQFKPKE